MFKPFSWEVTGQVKAVRELKTKAPDPKTGERRIWAHSVVIATIGEEQECQVMMDEANIAFTNQVRALKPGDMINAVGSFSEYAGKIGLTLSNFKPIKAA